MNIERFFAEQIREQRKAGSGAFHRRGKGVKHGMNSAFRTPYYYMSNKERKKLNGEVEISNMYDTIISFEEFKTKNLEQQITMLTRWREMHNNKEIQKQMGLTNSHYYALVKDLGISGTYTRKKVGSENKETTNKKIARKARTIQKAISEQKQTNQTELLLLDSKPAEVNSEPLVTILNGLNLQYNGEYSPEQLGKLFTKLQLLVDGEENKYKLALCLVEMG